MSLPIDDLSGPLNVQRHVEDLVRKKALRPIGGQVLPGIDGAERIGYMPDTGTVGIIANALEVKGLALRNA